MEQMPYAVETDSTSALATRAATLGIEPTPAVISSDWRSSLPVLSGARVTLRELRSSDAPSLLAHLATEEVARFMNPPPTTVEGFERLIACTHRERAAGNYVCFGVVPEGGDAPVGIFQIRSLEPSFGTAEWGFALGSRFWGSGLFEVGARRVLDFAFETIGVRRMEARAAVENGRGSGALRKLGAVPERLLRRSLRLRGAYFDQLLWSILDIDWQRFKYSGRTETVH